MMAMIMTRYIAYIPCSPWGGKGGDEINFFFSFDSLSFLFITFETKRGLESESDC